MHCAECRWWGYSELEIHSNVHAGLVDVAVCVIDKPLEKRPDAVDLKEFADWLQEREPAYLVQGLVPADFSCRRFETNP